MTVPLVGGFASRRDCTGSAPAIVGWESIDEPDRSARVQPALALYPAPLEGALQNRRRPCDCEGRAV